MSLSLGLDVGGDTLKAVVLGPDGTIVDHARRPVPSREVLDFVLATVAGFVRSHGIVSLGVGLAGLVSYPAGGFVWGPHVTGVSVPFRETLAAELGFDVAVDNDANLAALGEWRIGAGNGAEPMLMVVLGTGIGMGVMIGGRVYRGVSFAGEAGHISRGGVDSCSCGRSGCWETLVSGASFDRTAQAIARRWPEGLVARLAAGSVPSGEHLSAAAGAGDPAAGEAVARAGEALGDGLVDLVLLFDPARVVVGGGGAGAGEALLDAARRTLAERMPGSGHRPVVPVVMSHFGALSGAVGAALAGREVQNGPHEW